MNIRISVYDDYFQALIKKGRKEVKYAHLWTPSSSVLIKIRGE